MSVPTPPEFSPHSCIHYTCTDRTESSHEETLRASRKSLHHLQTSWRGHCDKKKSPLSHSVLNSCHINNLLHWDIQIPHKQFPALPHEAPRRKTQCVLIHIYLTRNLPEKLMFHGTHLEEYCSRHIQLKLCHTRLWALLWEFNRGCGKASTFCDDKRHHNLPFLLPQVRPQLTVHRVWQ